MIAKPPKDVAKRKLPDWLLVVGIFVIVATVTKFCTPLGKPLKAFIQPHIKAIPYVWPLGCEQKSYKSHEKIDVRCASENYYFSQYRDYGFPTFRGSKYYRVGNDIINVNCAFGDCNADAIIYNSFYQ